MEILLNIFILLISSAAIVGVVYLFIKKQGEKDIQSLKIELHKDRQNYFLPSRVEAYQRAVLLLERIHPNSIVMRLINPALPARVFQVELLKSIREEYDHNVAQQVFVSTQGWEMVRNSKEELIKIINMAGNQMTESSMSTDLAGKIFEIVAEVGKLPSEITVDYLKSELQKLF